MNIQRIDNLFTFEKGSLQSTKCKPGGYDFITAAANWKTHKEYTHEGEYLIFAAAAAGSLGRTHYVNGKFISSDLCFIIKPKDKENFPIDIQFYHIIFRELRNDIVSRTKAGTSKEAISLRNFSKYELPYFPIKKQLEIKSKFVKAELIRDELLVKQSHQLVLVSQLRQAFLGEAMQGKLIQQNMKDEPAEVLLGKIKVEKEKLIAENKIRKEKLQPTTRNLDEETLYDIPGDWEWCKLGEICNLITDGTHHTPNYINEGIPFLSVKNISNGFLDFSNTKFISIEEHKNLIKRCNPEFGDVLLTKVGTTGIAKVIDVRKDFSIFVSVALLKFNQELIYNKFLEYVINSPFVKQQSDDGTWGVGNKNLVLKTIKQFSIPIPPLSEQRRIVEKLEKLMKFCDELEANIRKSSGQVEDLLQVSLKEALEPK